jgi:UPF0755 protein
MESKKRERLLGYILALANLGERLKGLRVLRPSRSTLIALTLMFFTASVAIIVYGYQMFYSPNLQVKREQAYSLYIPEGARFQTVLDSLKKNRVVGDQLSFAFVAKLLKYQDKVLPGHYHIEPNMNNYAAIKLLRSGRQVPVRVTFTMARFPEDIAKKVAPKMMFHEEDLTKVLTDTAVARKYGFDQHSFLTMFLPNTYEVYWTDSPEAFVSRMHDEYQRFWTTERRQKAEKLGLSPIEVSVLGSIVQAETSKNDEKPRVAGVYLNRLRKKMRLEADPTLVYALGDFSLKRVLNKHKEIDSPYNTYKNAGLPPGPINLPSLATLKAVLDAETHEYLFFCAKDDFSGYHNFAVTYQEHLNNARRYQQALNKRGIR